MCDSSSVPCGRAGVVVLGGGTVLVAVTGGDVATVVVAAVADVEAEAETGKTCTFESDSVTLRFDMREREEEEGGEIVNVLLLLLFWLLLLLSPRGWGKS